MAEKRGSASGPPSTPSAAGLASQPAAAASASASGPNFERVQNFGAGGVAGFLAAQSAATGSGGGGAAPIS